LANLENNDHDNDCDSSKYKLGIIRWWYQFHQFTFQCFCQSYTLG